MIHVEPIKLLKGTHKHTAKTGQGCFMNVVSYLNGEPVITDKSECVCVTFRRPAIWLNDFMNDDERHLLLPYLLRAMGSATKDKVVISKRLDGLVVLANKMAIDAADAAAYAARAADAAAYADYAADAAAYAARAADAAANAARAADAAANAAARQNIITAFLDYFDQYMPQVDEVSDDVLARLNNLRDLNMQKVAV